MILSGKVIMRPQALLIRIIAGALGIPGKGTDAVTADESVRIEGELRQWHKVTLTLEGPHAGECDNDPNPFTDYRLAVLFRHESGSPQYLVPGYFCHMGVRTRLGDGWGPDAYLARTGAEPHHNYVAPLLTGR